MIPSVRWFLLLLIRGYQATVSRLLGTRCRFYPSCSAYAAESITRFGAARGTWFAITRVARCHPGCEGGHDPVPETFTWTPWRRDSKS